MAIVIRCWRGMTTTEGLFIATFKTVSKETGIHGTEDEVAISGFVMVIIAFGIIDQKKGHGGILHGPILQELVDT